MENLLVWIIVGAALAFTLRSFFKIYRGDGGCNCNCDNGCNKTGTQIQSSCDSKRVK